MPFRYRARHKCVLLVLGLLQGCSAFEGPQAVLGMSGPASLRKDSSLSNPAPGEIGDFELSYAKALGEQRTISKGDSARSTASTDLVSLHARQMAIDGISLVDANCRDFFKVRGEAETVLNVSRDTTSASGALASGVLSLASPANAVASAVLSLVTATTANSLDIYTKNFLFGANNIDSVRTMTMAALAVHKQGVLPPNDTSVWTFNDAVDVIMDHQNYCTPSKIRTLAVATISSGKFVATAATDTTKTSTVNAATAAAAGVAPTVAGTGNAAIAAVSAAAPAAASAADAIRKSGGTPEQIAQGTADAVKPAVAATVRLSLPNATAENQQKITNAITSVMGTAAARSGGVPETADRNIQVQVAP